MYGCAVGYTGQVTFYMVPEKHNHVYLVGLYLLELLFTITGLVTHVVDLPPLVVAVVTVLEGLVVVLLVLLRLLLGVLAPLIPIVIIIFLKRSENNQVKVSKIKRDREG